MNQEYPTADSLYDTFLNETYSLVPISGTVPTLKVFSSWDKQLPTQPETAIVDNYLQKGTIIFRAQWKNDLPELQIVTEIVELELNDLEWLDGTIQSTDGVMWKDSLDTGNNWESVTTLPTGRYEDDAATVVKIGVPGIYEVTYKVTSSRGHFQTGKRLYIVGAQKVGTDYVVFGQNFARKLEDSAIDSDSVIIDQQARISVLPLNPNSHQVGTVKLSDNNARKAYRTDTAEHILTFEVNEEPGLFITVKANVYDDIDDTPGNEKGVRANDVRILKKAYVKEDLPEKSQATVWDISDTNNPIVDINATSSVTLGAQTTAPETLQKITGMSVAHYTSGNLNVTKNVEIYETDVTLNAQNFKINLSEVNTLTEVSVQTAQYANVEAKEVGNGLPTVKADLNELEAIKATKMPGVFDLTFAATHSTNAEDIIEKKIEVTVVSKDKPEKELPNDSGKLPKTGETAMEMSLLLGGFTLLGSMMLIVSRRLSRK